MFRYIFLFFVCALLVGACSPQTTATTPIVIVVTATPDASAVASPTSAAVIPPSKTPIAVIATPPGGTAPAGATTATLNLKATDVKYVQAKQDINIRNGPGTAFDIVGGVYAGQTAQVTGFKSADDAWWRVVCPVDNVTDCWVSADPTLTEPTDSPNFGPTPTTTTALRLEAFKRELTTAFQSKNYDALREMMGNPFAVGYWRSEGTSPPREEALLQLRNSWLGPANTVVIDLAGKTDQSKLLDGSSPLGMWGPNVKAVESVYVQGLGASQKDEALLIIAERPDGSLYWYGMLFAGGGFQALN